MSVDAIIVVVGIIVMVAFLLLDKMRPGFTLFSGAIIFMALGIISPKELVEGFSNREMITIALLFLVGEGVRQSGALNYVVRRIMPRRRGRVSILILKMLPAVTAMSSVLNNTAVVIILAPIIKRWASRIGVSATKFLIPLSYAAILGGMCTLIGTSTNMVVNGMMVEAGYRGFTMFEIGQVGVVIAVVGLLYIAIFANKLLPEGNSDVIADDNSVAIILASRFPGVGSSLGRFNFERRYGARVTAVVKSGERIDTDLEEHILEVGDTLLIATDESFCRTWHDSSAFHIISSSDDVEDEGPKSRRRRWTGLALLLIMIVGATLGDRLGRGFDIFTLAAVVTVAMAATKLFRAKRYTKYITWDILIAIAAAFALSRAMINTGINDVIASWIVDITSRVGARGALAVLYLVTMLFTELVTNNAAVAIAFPVAVALSQQLGVDPMPMFVAISIAASASFSSPIGYQTNLIVQGVGGYKFIDYLRVGIFLNIITLIISVTLIPLIWGF